MKKLLLLLIILPYSLKSEAPSGAYVNISDLINIKIPDQTIAEKMGITFNFDINEFDPDKDQLLAIPRTDGSYSLGDGIIVAGKLRANFGENMSKIIPADMYNKIGLVPVYFKGLTFEEAQALHNLES